MRFGSVCSGIEAASVAWNPLGWKAAWLAEIEPFPSAALTHHYPDVPNLGDMTKLPERIASGEIEASDVFCGGTPCQAFSVAGKRESLADARGNLSLIFCDIADSIDAARSTLGLPPSIVFWENVPGVLSTKDNAFGCLLSQLCGGDEPLVAPDGWPPAGCVSGPSRTAAWRVLDAQYFGLAQRRRRVFVVASARNDFDPAAVLFEFDGVRRDSPPSRSTGQDVAGTFSARTQGGGGLGTDFDLAGGTQVAGTLQANGKAAGSATQQDAECGMLVPVAFGGNNTAGPIDVATALRAHGTFHYDFESETFLAQALPFDTTQITSTANYSNPKAGDPCHPLTAMHVRRLTVRECERLQGFQFRVRPDYPGAWQDAPGEWWSPDYTAIPGRRKIINPEKLDRDYIKYLARGGVKSFEECCNIAADGPRYKALGNSWAVPNVRWIGRRIDAAVKASA